MRKVLILVALLPGLALADSVGGPSSNSGVQTASPQNNAASLNYLQPAPDASAQNLAAPATNSANALQGSVPSSSDQLMVEAEGTPQTLSGRGTGNALATGLLAAAAVALLAVAVTVWQLSKPSPIPEPVFATDTEDTPETDHEPEEVP